jgi:hypothetical protein
MGSMTQDDVFAAFSDFPKSIHAFAKVSPLLL